MIIGIFWDILNCPLLSKGVFSIICRQFTKKVHYFNISRTFVEEQPPVQQIRIVNSDGSVTMGTVPQRQQQQQQIRVLNADGSLTPLNSSGGMRVVQPTPPPPEPKVRIVTSSGAGGTSPIKTTMTLSTVT